MPLIHLIIDGKAVAVEKGTSLLEAAKSNGIDIPTHCHDNRLRPYGGCRLCMVEISRNEKKRLVASCLYEAEDGLTVRTRSRQIDAIRKMIIELTWPIMSEYAEDYGAQSDRFKNKNTDCALCGRCTRFCETSDIGDIVYFRGRGIFRDIDVILKQDYDYSVFQECMSFCPGGRLMNRLTRIWGGE